LLGHIRFSFVPPPGSCRSLAVIARAFTSEECSDRCGDGESTTASQRSAAENHNGDRKEQERLALKSRWLPGDPGGQKDQQAAREGEIESALLDDQSDNDEDCSEGQAAVRATPFSSQSVRADESGGKQSFISANAEARSKARLTCILSDAPPLWRRQCI
jgi:hypothetical protein